MDIVFKTKPIEFEDSKGEAVLRIKAPAIERRHVDMNAARSHKRYGGLANSDLFPAILKRIMREHIPGGWFDLDNPPERVRVENQGFMVLVTIDVE